MLGSLTVLGLGMELIRKVLGSIPATGAGWELFTEV